MKSILPTSLARGSLRPDRITPTRAISLPFWAAQDLHHRLTLQIALACAAVAARTAGDELVRLQAAEEESRALARTARSHLPDAINAVLCAPIVTARTSPKASA